MTRWTTKLLLAMGFSLGVLALTAPAHAQDEKKPDAKKEGDAKPEMKKDDAKKPAEKKDGDKKPEEKKDGDKKPEGETKAAKVPDAKPVDWTKFPKFGDPVGGELVKITETTLTLRNQVAERNGNRVSMKNIDKEYTWHENGTARREKPPKFFNEKGLERPAKTEELDKLKKPVGVAGYMMDRSDLKTGDIVKLELVRPMAISPSKVKPEDLTIKYAIMVGEHPKPSKPLPPDEPKKKN